MKRRLKSGPYAYEKAPTKNATFIVALGRFLQSTRTDQNSSLKVLQNLWPSELNYINYFLIYEQNIVPYPNFRCHIRTILRFTKEAEFRKKGLDLSQRVVSRLLTYPR